LLASCYSESEVVDLLNRKLADSGEEHFEVVNNGAVGGPLDRMDEIRRHVAAGCTILTGTGWTQEGVRLYFIGP
jgi:hypothetical protein